MIEFTEPGIGRAQFTVQASILTGSGSLFLQATQQAGIGRAKQPDDQRNQDGSTDHDPPLVGGDERLIPRCTERGPDTNEAGSSSHDAAEIEQPGRCNELTAVLSEQLPK